MIEQTLTNKSRQYLFCKNNLFDFFKNRGCPFNFGLFFFSQKLAYLFTNNETVLVESLRWNQLNKLEGVWNVCFNTFFHNTKIAHSWINAYIFKCCLSGLIIFGRYYNITKVLLCLQWKNNNISNEQPRFSQILSEDLIRLHRPHAHVNRQSWDNSNIQISQMYRPLHAISSKSITRETFKLRMG